MIVQAYSLDQIMGPMVEALGNLKRTKSSTYITEGIIDSNYYRGRNLVDSDGDIHSWVYSSSKFATYLREARSNGTLSAVREHPHPLAGSVDITVYRSVFHNEFVMMKIYDVGALSKIVSGEDPQALLKYLPIEVRAFHMLQRGADTNKREFEVVQTFCHENCLPHELATNLLFDVAERAGKL